MAADVSVYNSTVYNKKGTTWLGSPLWKLAQPEVRQHWFIDSYIAAYIQMQYRVTGVHPTGLTIARGWRQVSTVYTFSCRFCSLLPDQKNTGLRWLLCGNWPVLKSVVFFILMPDWPDAWQSSILAFTYVYLLVYTYIYIYIYVICIYICIYVCIYISIYIYMYISGHLSYVYLCQYVHKYRGVFLPVFLLFVSMWHSFRSRYQSF